MSSDLSPQELSNLPFFVTGPGETDLFQIAVAAFLILVVLGFGAIYFTIQAIPERMAGGANKAQMQIIGLLGLLSLFTLNNMYWVAALILAAIPVNEIIAPFQRWTASRESLAREGQRDD